MASSLPRIAVVWPDGRLEMLDGIVASIIIEVAARREAIAEAHVAGGLKGQFQVDTGGMRAQVRERRCALLPLKPRRQS